jgi:hypothetical protein
MYTCVFIHSGEKANWKTRDPESFQRHQEEILAKKQEKHAEKQKEKESAQRMDRRDDQDHDEDESAEIESPFDVPMPKKVENILVFKYLKR